MRKSRVKAGVTPGGRLYSINVFEDGYKYTHIVDAPSNLRPIESMTRYAKQTAPGMVGSKWRITKKHHVEAIEKAPTTRYDDVGASLG